jgi:LysM repeat protein
MEKRPLPKRDAIIIVVLVHVGLALLLISMGSCGTSRTREVDNDIPPAVTQAEDIDVEGDYDVIEPDITTIETPTVVGDTPTVVTNTRAIGNEIRYVVKPGDSLWRISRTFGVTVDSIVERNDIQDAKLIRAGRELWIPNPTKGFDKATAETVPTTETTTVTGPTVTEPTVTEPTGTEPTVTEPTTETTTVGDTVDVSTIETFDYEVQPGDTIWKLARTYRTTTKIIMELNGITDPKTLRAGDTIRIPKATSEMTE